MGRLACAPVFWGRRGAFAVTSKTAGRAVRSFPRFFVQNRVPEPGRAAQRTQQARVTVLKRLIGFSCVVLGLAVCGCQKQAAPPTAAAGGGAMRAMPVQTGAVSLAP